MAVHIPNVNADHLRSDFKARIEQDISGDRCIWCKSGSKKGKRHQLLDCPNTLPQVDQRTRFCEEVFDALHGDYAVAYIHQLQLAHEPRQDSKTPFSTGRFWSQIRLIADATSPAAIFPALATAPTAAKAATLSEDVSHDNAAKSPVASATTQIPSVTIPVLSTASFQRADPANVPDVPSRAQQESAANAIETSTLTAADFPLGLSNLQIREDVPSVCLEDSATVTLDLPYHSSYDMPTADYTDGSKFRPDETAISQKLASVRDSHSYPIRKPRVSLQEQPKGQFCAFKDHEVLTNHFEIGVEPNVVFYEYRIVGIPETEKRAGKKRYMATVVKQSPLLFENQDSFASDMIDTIVSWKPLHKSITNSPVAPDEWPLIKVVDMNLTVAINLRYTGPVDVAGLQNYASSNHTDPTTFNVEQPRNALNILLTKCFHNYEEIFHLNSHKFFIRKAFLDLKATQDQIAPVRAIRGFSYTVKPGMGKILLNVTTVTSVFWNNYKVSEVLRGGLYTFGGDRNVLRGVSVHIDYDRSQKGSPNSTIDDQHSRIRRIRGFGQKIGQQTFDRKTKQGGKETTTKLKVAEYLKDTYNLDCNEQLVAVDLGSEGNPSWFPADWLTIVPDQIWARIVPDAIAEAFHRYSCKVPNDSRALIERLAFHSDWFAQDAADSDTDANENSMLLLTRCPPLRLDPKMLQIQAACLPFPEIIYGKQGRADWNAQAGRWNLAKRLQFMRGGGRAIQWKLIVQGSTQGLVQSY